MIICYCSISCPESPQRMQVLALGGGKLENWDKAHDHLYIQQALQLPHVQKVSPIYDFLWPPCIFDNYIYTICIDA